MIGYADDSGNLRRAIDTGKTVQHLHIEGRVVDGNKGYNDREALALDMEEFLTTKFDDNGDVVDGTSC